MVCVCVFERERQISRLSLVMVGHLVGGWRMERVEQTNTVCLLINSRSWAPATQTAISPSPQSLAGRPTATRRLTERQREQSQRAICVWLWEELKPQTVQLFLMAELMECSALRGVRKSQLNGKLPLWWICVKGIFLSLNVLCIVVQLTFSLEKMDQTI